MNPILALSLLVSDNCPRPQPKRGAADLRGHYRLRLPLLVGNGKFVQTLSSHIRQIVKRSISDVSCRASSSWISVSSRFVSAGDSTSRSDATAEIRDDISSFRVAAPVAVRCNATSRPSFPGRRSTSRSETRRTVPECDKPRIRRSLSLVMPWP